MEKIQADNEQVIKDLSDDTSQVNWEDLTNRVFDDINRIRKDPKFLIK